MIMGEKVFFMMTDLTPPSCHLLLNLIYYYGIHVIREHVNQTRGKTLCITTKVSLVSLWRNVHSYLAQFRL